MIVATSRYFSANYAIVVALLGVYSLLTNPLLLVALGFLIGGFLAISRFGMSYPFRPHPFSRPPPASLPGGGGKELDDRSGS